MGVVESREGTEAVVGSGEGSGVGSAEVSGIGSGEGLGSGLGDSVDVCSVVGSVVGDSVVASVVGSVAGFSANAVGPVSVIRIARTTDVAIGLRIRWESRRYRRPNAHVSPRCVLDRVEADFLRNIHPSSRSLILSARPAPKSPPDATDRYPSSCNCCRQVARWRSVGQLGVTRQYPQTADVKGPLRADNPFPLGTQGFAGGALRNRSKLSFSQVSLLLAFPRPYAPGP